MLSAPVFAYGYRPLHKHFKATLRHWTIASYVVFIFYAVWYCIGISSTAKVGLKHRWEFYFLQALLQMSNGVANVVFRVLFPQIFPRGREV